MRNWSNEEIQRYLGEEHGCWLTHSLDDEVRESAPGETLVSVTLSCVRRLGS
jgi:hypothetical protein